MKPATFVTHLLWSVMPAEMREKRKMIDEMAVKWMVSKEIYITDRFDANEQYEYPNIKQFINYLEVEDKVLCTRSNQLTMNTRRNVS